MASKLERLAKNPWDFRGPKATWWIPLNEPLHFDGPLETSFLIPRWNEELVAQTEGVSGNVWIAIAIRIHTRTASWNPTPNQRYAFELANNEMWPRLTDEWIDTAAEIRNFVVELEVTFNCTSPPGDDERSRAFEEALGKIQEIQDSYALATRVMPRPITLETLPDVIPPQTETTQGVVEQLLYGTNANVQGLSETPTQRPTFEDLDKVRPQIGGAFWSYHLHRKAAFVALDKEGDYSKSLISAATAAEVLLDELLRLLLWERGDDPEEAAGRYFSGRDNATTINRLRNHYKEFLDYNWDPDSEIALQMWRVGIAGPRNWALHNGMHPPKGIAENALKALIALDTFVGERVAECASDYPRCAYLLVGRDGLEQLGAWSEQISDCVDSPTEVAWHSTLARWRDIAVRTRAKSENLEPQPEVDRGLLHIIFLPHRQNWVLYDQASERAIRVKPVPANLSEEQQAWLAHLVESETSYGTVIAMTGHEGAKWHTRGKWQRPYKLLPTLSVMRDDSDSPLAFLNHD